MKHFLLLRLSANFIALLPLLWLIGVLLTDSNDLGADPAKEIQHFLGFVALTLLISVFVFRAIIISLKQNQLRLLHKTLGAWAMIYVILHLFSYFLLELGGDTALFLSEITQRVYLILGALAIILLLVSVFFVLPIIQRSIGRVGFKAHQLVYVSLLLSALHYYISTKAIEVMAVVYVVIAVVLVAFGFFQKRFKVSIKK